MNCPAAAPRRRQAGFTLVEVLVAVLIACIGLLGLVSMQALALATTQVSSVRALVALQSSSLGAAMHNNPGYWRTPASPTRVDISASGINDSPKGELVTAPPSCDFSPATGNPNCTPTELAAFDLQNWARHMAGLLPSYQARLNCVTDARLTQSCQLTVLWQERYVSMGRKAQADSSATGGQRSYTMYFQP